ncbi:conserved hypothetical protein [Staphylococcus capitis]|nr:conserved hypothetical protein [Staphylococcus capitis CR01]CQD25740.1 conserved hypothetical protein [Staphylococcus capitis]CQD29098.1 conserved hypothetical protein [Staphylococcus capitis]CQD32687.1 conserved hypothetical protein [Staphylococcus capitis]CRN11450.1 conserved hypothetical protein [Staphylococcus capitis]
MIKIKLTITEYLKFMIHINYTLKSNYRTSHLYNSTYVMNFTVYFFVYIIYNR